MAAAELDAILIAVAVQNATGNEFAALIVFFKLWEYQEHAR
jgi:hypothetical protein